MKAVLVGARLRPRYQVRCCRSSLKHRTVRAPRQRISGEPEVSENLRKPSEGPSLRSASRQSPSATEPRRRLPFGNAAASPSHNSFQSCGWPGCLLQISRRTDNHTLGAERKQRAMITARLQRAHQQIRPILVLVDHKAGIDALASPNPAPNSPGVTAVVSQVVPGHLPACEHHSDVGHAPACRLTVSGRSSRPTARAGARELDSRLSRGCCVPAGNQAVRICRCPPSAGRRRWCCRSPRNRSSPR